MAWVYVLECSDGSFYVGSTIDLERRVSDHQLGLGAAYTRYRRPVRLLWAADFHRVDEAFAFEKQVQGWGRAKRRALVEGRLEDLPGLASRARRGEAASDGFETLAQRLAPRPSDEPPGPTTGPRGSVTHDAFRCERKGGDRTAGRA